MFFTFCETRVTPCQMGMPTFVYMRGTVRLASELPGTLLASKWACKALPLARAGGHLSHFCEGWVNPARSRVGLRAAWHVGLAFGLSGNLRASHLACKGASQRPRGGSLVFHFL